MLRTHAEWARHASLPSTPEWAEIEYMATLNYDKKSRRGRMELCALRWGDSKSPLPRDLSGVNLDFADLRYAILSGLWERDHLTSIDKSFVGASVRGANLRNAVLRCADLRGADLSGADLRMANLAGSKLADANLRCADFGGGSLAQANLKGANLRGANLLGTDLGYANFANADLSGAEPANVCETGTTGATIDSYGVLVTPVFKGAAMPDGRIHG